MSGNKRLNVMELFAGVGGFRLGLERANSHLFNVTWANQWEPSRKAQDAFLCYTKNFKTGEHSNEDIATISNGTFSKYKPDLLVGGFPCQDYSVARTKSGEKGIQGKKGVLFWEIRRALVHGQPRYVLLENVDRLLKTPSKQRGRDFAVMLATFAELDYTVEWRVINAADYGFAQRRRRVFIFAYKNDLTFNKEQLNYTPSEIIYKKGFFAKSFPVEDKPYKGREDKVKLLEDIVKISDDFSFNFHPAGFMHERRVYSSHLVPVKKEAIPLQDIILPEDEIGEQYYLTPEQEEKFIYLRGAKREERVSRTGHKYMYTEGGMSPVDSLELPGRTMLTSEGSNNRSSHIIEVDGKKRFLTPIECERLNGFPDNWTDSMTNRMRYFVMGNALVIGLIEIMGKRIEEIEKKEKINKAQLTLL